MAHLWATSRAPNYAKYADRSTPSWFRDAKLGIFIHWGPYSVPAWAPPSGQLGQIPMDEHHKQNPYAEWYFNSVRFPGSPSAKHHHEVYGNAPYDDFIDQWKAEQFDASAMCDLFKRAGAEYVVPVTKHHDGVTLWDAPETGTRNTVHRGPKRDLVDEWAKGCEAHDLRLGFYYSTGIDWHVWPTELPWDHHRQVRPGINDHAYNEYIWKHCQDLIQRYRPSVLWGDIDWPKAGVAPGPYSVEKLFDNLYQANPEAVVNDRFGDTHWDFSTVEYHLGAPPGDDGPMWQFTRGIGLSFGYNQAEDESHSLTGSQAIRLLIDVSSNGGNLLLNVGPDASGAIPLVQLQCLNGMAEWMSFNAGFMHGTRSVSADIARPSGPSEYLDNKGNDKGDWVRWLKKGSNVFAFVDAKGAVRLDADWNKIDKRSARNRNGQPLVVDEGGSVNLTQMSDEPAPIVLSFSLS